jgi:hypothetical protein
MSGLPDATVFLNLNVDEDHGYLFIGIGLFETAGTLGNTMRGSFGGASLR